MGMSMGIGHIGIGRKLEWECSVVMGMGGNSNGRDFMGMGGNANSTSHFSTPPKGPKVLAQTSGVVC